MKNREIKTGGRAWMQKYQLHLSENKDKEKQNKPRLDYFAKHSVREATLNLKWR